MRHFSGFRSRAIATVSLLILINLGTWAVALWAFHPFPLLLGTAMLAYTFGLRHALDADHISAIDNVTRKLMQDGQRPLGVGFFFSLGHSTIVVLLSVAIALTATRIHSHFPALEQVGGLIGTCVSAAFLLVIAGINLVVLRGVYQAFGRVKRGEGYDEQDLDATMKQLGFMGRIFRPMLRLVDRSWKMYAVGFLFGLGFDTATEVGVLGISAAVATQGLPIWWILVFPALFTAGMCLIDTADGILMLGAYGWAYVHPIRKLYYNMTITAVSVLVAIVVVGIELLGVIQERFSLQGTFWESVKQLNGRYFGTVGILIIAIFVASWLISFFCYRLLGYAQLEQAPTFSSVPDPG